MTEPPISSDLGSDAEEVDDEPTDAPTVMQDLPDLSTPADDPEVEDLGELDTTSLYNIQCFLAIWQNLLDGDAQAVAVLHRRARSLVYVNPACHSLFDDGLTQAAVRAAIPAEALAAIDSDGVWRGRSDTPTIRQCDCLMMAIPDHNGHAEGIYAVWLPERESPFGWRKRDVLRQVLDHGSDLVVGVDPQGRIVYRNERAWAFFPRELLGMRAVDALQGAAVAALEGKEADPEPTVDAHNKRRVLRWRGATIRVGPQEGEQDETGSSLSATLALGRDITEEANAAEEVRVRVQRLEAMHAISLAIGRGEQLESVYAMAFARLADVVPLRTGKLYLIDHDVDDDEPVLRTLFAWDQGRGHPRNDCERLADHPASEAAIRRATVQRNTSGPAALRFPMLRSADRMGIQTVLSVPLVVEGEVLGVLWLMTHRRGGFSPDHIEASEEAAAQIANAMQRQGLLDEIEDHARTLEVRVDERTRELQSTQSQLLHAAKLSSIGEMASGLAHELNQPLNVLSGYIELLQGEVESEIDTTKAFNVMEAAADRMASLVEHLRNFSRAGAEKMRPIDLAEIVEMARVLSSRASKRPVSVLMEKPTEAFVVLADPNRLEQMVINLLANAMQATEEAGGRQVRVEIKEFKPEQVALEITDQGHGVPAEVRDSIFDPFFTTKPRGKGTGLGLSISSKVVQEHGGSIEIDDGEDGGAVFRVLLPRHRGH